MDIGSKWNGWTIEKKLGTGSFGTVYKVTKDEFKHHYESALKVISIPQSESELSTIRSEGMNDESVTEYFQSMVEDITEELALMSKLKGKTNIVSYEDHIVNQKEDGFGWNIYARMELLTPLNDYIQNHTLTIREVIQLGIDMCQALEVCQKYNIIHRDIKPENIFVSDLGDFKLGDFGIARQLEKTVAAMSKKGTYTYMAPEIYKGLPYNSTVDIYSLGIVLYRFLNNNRTPFLPAYPKAIKYSDKEKANVLRMSGKEIAKPCNAKGRLAEIVLKACAYKPEDRYESAVELKQALKSILYNENEADIIYPDGDKLTQDNSEPKSDIKEKKQNKQIEDSPEGTVYLFQSEAKKRAKALAEEKAKREAEEKAEREAEEKARREYKEKAKREAEEKAKREAEEKARRETEEKAKREAEEKAKREAEEKAKHEAEEKAKCEAEEKAKREDEEKSEPKKSKKKYGVIGIVLMVFIVLGIILGISNCNKTEEKEQSSYTKNEDINNDSDIENETQNDLNNNSSNSKTEKKKKTTISNNDQVTIDSVVDNGKVLSIKTAKVSNDGFYYEGKDGYIIEDKGLVIYGSLDYSRKLSKNEKDSFMHGGELYKSNGEIYKTKKNPSERNIVAFWSDYDAKKFSVKIPDNIKPGKYKISLYQSLFGEEEESEIHFTVR